MGIEGVGGKEEGRGGGGGERWGGGGRRGVKEAPKRGSIGIKVT